MRKNDEVNETMKIGSLIRRLRKEREMTQSDLAEKLNVSYQQVQKYENGQTSLNIPRIKKIASVLKVPLSLFFNEKGFKAAESAEFYGKGEHEPASLTEKESQLLRLFRRVKKTGDRERIIKLLRDMGAGKVN